VNDRLCIWFCYWLLVLVFVILFLMFGLVVNVVFFRSVFSNNVEDCFDCDGSYLVQ
jgi:hypothetical protein